MPSGLDHALFYGSENGDRVYTSDSFEYWLKKFFTTGVFANELAVTADGSSMVVSVGAGYCNVNGKVRFFENSTSLTLGVAHGTYTRIDSVVVERNDTERDITIKLVEGTASASPVPAEPVRSNGVYQLVLARITVPAGTTRIAQANIEDCRQDSALCGIVMTTVETPSFDTLYSQFTDAFNTWFQQMKDQLSEDAAGRLQLEIDGKVDKVTGKGLSTNDYTTAEKAKLEGLGSDYTLSLTNGNYVTLALNDGVLAIELRDAAGSLVTVGSTPVVAVQQKSYTINKE